MSKSLPITIVGGGLAGLTLGIALRRKDVSVTLIEASRYPRHRVCGEFISGKGKAALSELGLIEKMEAAGMQSAKTAAFFSHATASPVRQLPETALCLSRLRLDTLLADEFRKLGGTLNENSRWRDVFGEGIIRATGRRIQAFEEGWRWFGLKIHARNVSLQADLEMHFTDSGYVGICRIEEERVNICGLFRSQQAEPTLAKEWKNWLCGARNSKLQEKLAGADFDESSFCSVAGLSLQANRAGNRTECSIGDSISMIPPVTGNGMSMAFESAQIAAGPLLEFSRKELDWDETRRLIAARCDRKFRKRLFWSGWLQQALLRPKVATNLIRFGSNSDTIWRLLFEKTR